MSSATRLLLQNSKRSSRSRLRLLSAREHQSPSKWFAAASTTTTSGCSSGGVRTFSSSASSRSSSKKSQHSSWWLQPPPMAAIQLPFQLPFQLPLREPEEGTGFDNFLKRQNQQDKKEREENKKTTTEGSSEGGEDNNNNKDKKNQWNSNSGGSGGGSGGDNSNNNNNNIVVILTMLLAAAFIMRQSDNADGTTSGGGGGDSHNDMSGGNRRGSNSGQTPAATNLMPNLDLTWSEFLQLLEQEAIFKIVVHAGQGGGESENGSTRARVYLKPGALLPSKGEGDPTMMMDSHHDHSNEMTTTITSTSTTDRSSSGGVASNTPLVYRNLRIGSAASLERKLEEAQRALGRGPASDIPVQYQVDSGVTQELLGLIPWLLLSGFLIASARGAAGRMGGVGATGSSGGGPGGMFGMGKSTAQKFTKEMNIGVGFKDVAGCDEAKREIMEFVEFLQTPDRFTQLGAKIPKGALLAGPPGTGKTLLAKAVAGEAGVPFFSLAGSEFLEMFVGVGPSRVRDLFKEARENAPCIIFIDEIDSIGRKRGKSSAMGGNDERENTLNQLLVEMDGFDPSTGVICLAGTNRDDILDPALTRPGRFDRKIQVDLPDIAGRKEVFQVHLKNITLVEGLGPVKNPDSKSDDLKQEEKATPEQQSAIDTVASRLAGLTPGFSGADIANICNEAAIVAARRSAEYVTMDDFEKATDRVIGGLESNRIMSKEERNIVAYHEAGHAVAGWFLEHADPLLKVTIIPRASGALGFAQYLPKEVALRTQDQIMDIVAMALAGRAAEEIFFGSVTTGASDDLRRVTQMVYSTIQLYGMNERLGQLAFPKDPTAMWDERPYSEKTAKAMDEEAKQIVDRAYERTLALLRERKDEVDKVAKLLLEKETINHDEIYDLIGERPFKGDKNYEEYVSRRQAERKRKEEEQQQAAADGNTTDDANAPNLNPSF